jgi:hypothetical protein
MTSTKPHEEDTKIIGFLVSMCGFVDYFNWKEDSSEDQISFSRFQIYGGFIFARLRRRLITWRSVSPTTMEEDHAQKRHGRDRH